MKTNEVKTAEAGQRKKDRTNLTNAQQVAILDDRLGKGVGARKERARLSK